MPVPDAHEGYLDTIERMEPDLHMVDRDAALASIAISLKRIADALEGGGMAQQISLAITEGIWKGLKNR